ncbi:hypothetical protein PGT21_021885 [Puccinia graminis f. sp. tritici]|uniref:Uncharacterized protein n=1 Tax=Puccinia graminis f. sp. tritici TaxID=56615 RepID=A0A5B0NQ58_PUCGR|nr:hypothetical protein PGT21_021885 [Puccinia graminis f. sp. tritici]
MTSMDQPGSMSPEQATRAPRVAMNDKLDSICSLIENLNLTPKEFVVAFLEQNHDNVAFRRRYWGTEKGWDSTLRLILGIKRLANTHMEGRRLWEELILSEPKSGLAPKGAYHNSSTLTESFFSMEELATRNANLVEQMPFLYKLLCSKILGNGTQPTACASQDPMEDLSDEEDAVDLEDNIDDMDGIVLRKHRDPVARRANRVKTMARTICAMVAFGRNRRHNGFQLSNSLIFLAAGVTERVSSYLNYIGVSSSRRTAHAALHTLGKSSYEIYHPYKQDVPRYLGVHPFNPAKSLAQAQSGGAHQGGFDGGIARRLKVMYPTRDVYPNQGEHGALAEDTEVSDYKGYSPVSCQAGRLPCPTSKDGSRGPSYHTGGPEYLNAQADDSFGQLCARCR